MFWRTRTISKNKLLSLSFRANKFCGAETWSGPESACPPMIRAFISGGAAKRSKDYKLVFAKLWTIINQYLGRGTPLTKLFLTKQPKLFCYSELCHKQVLEWCSYADIKHSDWLKLVTWFATANQSAFVRVALPHYSKICLRHWLLVCHFLLSATVTYEHLYDWPQAFIALEFLN